jgi:transposase-like protein
MDILQAKINIVQAAREHHVSETSINNWKRQFLEAGRLGLSSERLPGTSRQEADLEAENESLRTALKEATTLVRVWKMSAESSPGASR